MAAVLRGKGGSYLGRKKKKVSDCIWMNSDINSPRDMSQALMFRSDVIRSEQRQTAFSVFCVQTPMASKRVRISGLLVTQHPPTLPGKAQFSIKTLAERQVFLFSQERWSLRGTTLLA